MSKRPTVAVYTPVLNEAAHVERWADTARQADLLVMLDTGSEDATYELAESCGIQVARANIVPFRFDDARNMALHSIPRNIDIAIQLDADELFEDGWRAAIDQADPNVDRWSYTLKSEGPQSWATSVRTNAVRLGKGHRWQHPIHEVIVGPPAGQHLEGLSIIHRPDKGKSRAYVLAMLEQFSAAEPDDARLLFYLGREYRYRAMWKKARETLWEYLHHPKATWAPERQEAYLFLAKIDSNPERWLWKAVAEEPRRREPFFYLALHYESRGKMVEAQSLMLQARERTSQTIYMTHTAAWGDEFEKAAAKIERKQK